VSPIRHGCTQCSTSTLSRAGHRGADAQSVTRGSLVVRYRAGRLRRPHGGFRVRSGFIRVRYRALRSPASARNWSCRLNEHGGSGPGGHQLLCQPPGHIRHNCATNAGWTCVRKLTIQSRTLASRASLSSSSSRLSARQEAALGRGTRRPARDRKSSTGTCPYDTHLQRSRGLMPRVVWSLADAEPMVAIHRSPRPNLAKKRPRTSGRCRRSAQAHARCATRVCATRLTRPHRDHATMTRTAAALAESLAALSDRG